MTDAGDLAQLSRDFLAAVRHGAEADRYRSRIAALDATALDRLGSDRDAATAFWLNCYNAVVQLALTADPSLLARKRAFFGDDRLTVAGTDLSLDDVEHGILRSSKWKYGLGYVPRLFPSAFERRHRLPAVDPRIHFGLNCGAESCPAILAYSASDLDDELDASARSFLQQSCSRDPDAAELRVTRLFLYYRGDFGGRSGIYECLERYDVLDQGERPSVRYAEYDWTRHVGNYAEDRA